MYRLAILIAFLGSTLLSSTSYAQSPNQGRGFGQGSFGQGSRGQGSFGQGGRGAFGNPVGAGQSRGGAGFGTSAFGQPGAGFGGGGGTGIGGLGQQAFGNNQFGAGAGADAFLGNDGQQMQNFFRALNRGRQRSATQNFAIENLNELRNQGGDGNSSDTRPPVRVQLRPAFETPLGTIGRIQSELETRLIANAAELGISDVKVTMEGRILTLEGTVATEHQRNLAEKVISLEPGVSGVDNRLTVEAAAE